ncbi:hypothetical protein EVA_20504 [gut metagenome]|uniref:Uncharacterized protein n=1 Tax=gut metagenome TaxID=749906 RepID=J9BUY1_9ZZZZ
MFISNRGLCSLKFSSWLPLVHVGYFEYGEPFRYSLL